MPTGVYPRTEEHISGCRKAGLQSIETRPKDFSRRVSEKMKIIQNDPAVKERISRQAKERWSDPLYRQNISKKASEATKRQWKKDDTLRIALKKANNARKLHPEESRIRRKEAGKKNVKKNIESWIGFIPAETRCQCCGETVYFAQKNKTKEQAIHFDHRNGATPIRPSSWLRRNFCNEENKKRWVSFDFGILCEQCNKRIPTENRDRWISNVVRYNSRKTNIHASEGSGGS